jgi:hypothetical protein
MSDIANVSNEHKLESFFGLLPEVSNRMAAMGQNEDTKIVALTILGITDQHAARLSNGFKNSRAVQQYLYGDLDPEFYDFIVDALVPKVFPTPTLLMQEKLHTAVKRQMINSGDFATAEQINAIAALSAPSSRIRPNQWSRRRLIFSFTHDGVTYFPIYALQADRNFSPNPAISSVLEIFGMQKGGLECAAWFASVNNSLDGLSPKEVLRSEPAKVISAAQKEMLPG